jgi:phospholipase C
VSAKRGGWRLLFVSAAALALMAAASAGPAQARSLCGTMKATAAPRHVLIVMLENRSYAQVIGNSAAPFENTLARTCGVATSMWGATHSSAANYLAVSAGQYPSSSVYGCNYAACASNETTIYQQLDSAGRAWKAYEEAMPSACDKSSSGSYKIGHNPPIFATGISTSECKARDVPVASLTAKSGAFWNDLHARRLRAVSWITPDTSNDGEASCGGSCALSLADSWLQNFVSLVAASPAYRSGHTAIFVTYDEGTGPDSKIAENCADRSADLAGSQPSCHVPFFVIYPGTMRGAHNGTFFDHYSLTRTVEDFFGLGYLANAADPQTASLAGHFGLVK